MAYFFSNLSTFLWYIHTERVMARHAKKPKMEYLYKKTFHTERVKKRHHASCLFIFYGPFTLNESLVTGRVIFNTNV
jgi:hypothetical protein